MIRAACTLFSMFAVSITISAGADCTGTNQLAGVLGTRSCDRGGSSPDVCAQDSSGVVSCGTGDGVTVGRITEVSVAATQIDLVSDGTDWSEAIQIWGTNTPGHVFAVTWCCFFQDATELIVEMNDSDNDVRYGCHTYAAVTYDDDGTRIELNGSLDVHIPTETHLKAGHDDFDGGTGNDTAMGDSGDDFLWDCSGGDDHFLGEGGADYLWGGLGEDLLEGGDGADEIYGYDGADEIRGGQGVDLLFGEKGGDLIHGGLGNDEIDGGYGADDLYGDPGADEIRGADGEDCIYGGGGDDYLSGGDGQDLICGGDDDDVMKGKGSPDQIIGEAGLDRAQGGTGVDTCDAETESSCPLDPAVSDRCEQSCREGVVEPKPASRELDEREMEKLRKKARRAWLKRKR